MKKSRILPFLLVCLACATLTPPPLAAQVVQVGAGSYTKTFPGVDVAGRNGFPSGSPQLSGNAADKPVPTNDWWSALIKNNHANNLFNYPFSMRTLPGGLDVGHVVPPSGPGGSTQPLSDLSPIIVGVSGLNANQVTVSDHTDWTVTMSWTSGEHAFNATSGIGMPFLYFTKSQGAEARVTVNLGAVTINGEQLLIVNSQNSARFAVYAPTGSTWSQSGNVYTSTLNGQNYWSMAMLPPPPVSAAAAAAEYQQFAYAFPVNTEVTWAFDEGTSLVRTDFQITAVAREGTSTTVLQGLLPHQWGYLAGNSPVPAGFTYRSIRGDLRMLAGNHFATERAFHGILPTLPFIPGGSDRLQFQELQQKVALLQNEALSTWTDSYNEGQVMNRLIQTARIADLIGNTAARDQMLNTVRDRLEDWLTATPGEVAFLFHYNTTWSALLGYPAGHGQDTNLNDHHFHWGYFIHAAAFVEQFQPGWVEQWGGMIDHLIRDAANASRTDPQYPFLRNFSPFAGHSWANGFATFPFGNDQESSSESMQFNSALIHWGTLTGNKAVRDLGIYLYTTEQTATEEYWFDVNERTLKPEYNYSLVSRIWGNGYDNQTFWTGDIAAAYGIQLYPIHGGSLYLGHNLDYAQKLWNEMAANTGILSNQANPNLWHDVYWQFLSFTDPARALDLYDSYPNRALKFGISDALTYHWLHAMYALGQVDATITADYPIAAAFRKNGTVTYVAHNYGDAPRTVAFSDGGELLVPARAMATSRDSATAGTLTSSFTRAHPGGSVGLQVEVTGGSVERVEFFRGSQKIGESSTVPHQLSATNLPSGIHTFFARLHYGDAFTITNSVNVQVGDQVPFHGTPASLPGTIDAGHFDRFEGGLGQGIAYHDTGLSNNGNYRLDEYVDVEFRTAEGATVGWTARGEWLEYTVDVETSGIYTLSFRFASGNSQGGGPLRLLSNGVPLTSWLSLPSTGGWGTFSTRTVSGLELGAGTQIIRVAFDGGEVNLGRMSFSRTGPLSIERPIAHAGGNRFVQLPAQTAMLNGSQSSVAADLSATFQWTQIYGPSVIDFSDTSVASPTISNLVEGIYRVQLTVSDGSHASSDEALVIVSTSGEIAPSVSLTQPLDGFTTYAGQPFTVSASARDLDGSIASVAFYSGFIRIGLVREPPYAISWKATAGDYLLTAVATDNSGLSTTSDPVLITILPPLSCQGVSSNGDFAYVISGAGQPPSITFVPQVSGVGSQICILYYNKTGTAPFPGYIVTPGVAHPLVNVAPGETVHFYYTYSHPAGGERTTMNQIVSRVIGGCGQDYVPTTGALIEQWRRAHFPAATVNDPALEAAVWGDLADPRGDRRPNLLRFYLNEDPLAPSNPSSILWAREGADFVYRYTRISGAPAGMGQMEWSSDLLVWSSGGLTETVLASAGGVEQVEVRLSGEAAQREQVFLRLRVTR